MDFSLSEDQLSMVDATRRFLESEYPYPLRGNPADANTARARWTALADMGLLGLGLDARWGGSGFGMVDLALLAREMGRCHAGEGVLASVVLGGRLLQRAGDERHCQPWLTRVAAGHARLALAHAEPTSRYSLTQVATRAAAVQGGYRIDGQKSLVLQGAQADALLVLARTAGSLDDAHGLSLFLLPKSAPGLHVREFRMLDGRQAAHVQLEAVHAEPSCLVGELHRAMDILQPTIQEATVWCCAEATGAMDTLIGTTTEYLQTRKQFGSPLAKFQTLQHRMADCMIAMEQAESMAYAAAVVLEQAPEHMHQRVIATAKALGGQAGQQISEAAIQLHGAMGMTDECRVGHFAKLLATLNLLFGETHHHTRWYADHGLAAETAPDEVEAVSPEVLT